MSTAVKYYTSKLAYNRKKTNVLKKLPKGKTGKTRITRINLCESCGASRRLIAFRSASGARYLCRDCAGRQGN